MAGGLGTSNPTVATAEAPPTAPVPRTVFISYASPDAEFANTVCEFLENQSIRCWIAPRDVAPGALYADAIVRAINEVQVALVLLSKSSVASPHVGKEIERASAKQKRVVTLRLDAAELTPAFEYFLSESQWIDMPALDRPRALIQVADAVRFSATPPAPQGLPHGSGAPAKWIKWSAVAAGLVIASLVIAGISVLATHPWSLRGTSPQPAAASSAAEPKEKSIAVMPFVDLSEKKDQEYFADGMAVEILDLLAQVPGIRVIGRTSSFQFKNQSEDLRTIGAKLGVAYVLEGSVRKSASQVRVTADLIDANDGTRLWSGTYDRDMGDVLKMQDEIAAGLVRALAITTRADDLQSRSTLTNPESYNAYLRGRYAFDRFDEAGFEEAARWFSRAIELDPKSAAAAAWLAFTYDCQGEWGFSAPTVAFERARKAATEAQNLDSKVSLAHLVLGAVHTVYDWDWPAADQKLKHGLELVPHDPYALAFLSRLALVRGEDVEALRLINSSLERDPLLPTDYIVLSWIQLRRGHLREAEAAARRALDISPTYVGAHFYLGLVLLALDERKQALATMQLEAADGGRRGGVAMAYAALGRTADANAALADMIKAEADGNAFGIAEVYAYRNQPEQSIQWLERAYRQHDAVLYTVKADFPFRSLESDPRYKAFLQKMNLPD